MIDAVRTEIKEAIRNGEDYEIEAEASSEDCSEELR